jgi:hypothetical protein
MMKNCKKIIDLEEGFLAACENGDMATARIVCPGSADRVKSRALYIAMRKKDERIVEMLAERGANFGRRDFVSAYNNRSAKIMRAISDAAPHLRNGGHVTGWRSMLPR